METIEVTDPKVIKLNIDVEQEKINVVWAKMTASGVKVDKGSFTFWKTLPPRDPMPATWYELNSSDLQKVVDIIQLAENFVDANV